MAVLLRWILYTVELAPSFVGATPSAKSPGQTSVELATLTRIGADPQDPNTRKGLFALLLAV
jgi:hypothetical protein